MRRKHREASLVKKQNKPPLKAKYQKVACVTGLLSSSCSTFTHRSGSAQSQMKTNSSGEKKVCVCQCVSKCVWAQATPLLVGMGVGVFLVRDSYKHAWWCPVAPSPGKKKNRMQESFLSPAGDESAWEREGEGARESFSINFLFNVSALAPLWEREDASSGHKFAIIQASRRLTSRRSCRL